MLTLFYVLYEDHYIMIIPSMGQEGIYPFLKLTCVPLQCCLLLSFWFSFAIYSQNVEEWYT